MTGTGVELPRPSPSHEACEALRGARIEVKDSPARNSNT